MQPFALATSITLSRTAGDLLQAGVPPDGNFVFKPGGAGFVDRDGALGIKFTWNRLVPGRLQVGGRRLDGDAPPARTYLTDYGDEGFQPTYLVFPTPGCCEITGGVWEARLSFIVFVEMIGEGPDWRFEGVQRVEGDEFARESPLTR